MLKKDRTIIQLMKGGADPNWKVYRYFGEFREKDL